MLELEAIWQPEIQQTQFRMLLEAMSRPGACYPIINDVAKQHCALSVLATLVDAEVSLADPHNLLDKNDWTLLQAKSSVVEQADYIVCDAALVPDFLPKLGTLPSPEQSATVVLVVDKLGQGDVQLKLSGPGIEHNTPLAISGLDVEWLAMRETWNATFPLGVDFILVDANQVTALPRTIRAQVV